MSVRVFAPAKINLTLKVGRLRQDGLHPLQSVVMFADIGDWIEAAPGNDLSLKVVGPFAGALTNDESNLVLRAAKALAQAAGVARLGAALTLTKNLPVASGIGGGSSDAAATLRALKALWGLDMNDIRLADLARGLGADVPVCVGGRSAFMTGAGEVSAPLHLPLLHAVLINPLRPLATQKVYQRFDEMGLGGDLVAMPPPNWTQANEAIAGARSLGNDLEAPAIALMPEIGAIAGALRADPRVRYAALSGSGATLFAIVDEAAAAEGLVHDLRQANPAYWVQWTSLGAS